MIGVAAFLTSIAATLGLLAATVTAVVILAKSPIFGRPIVYVWRKLVSEPGAKFFKEVVAEAVDDRITHRLNQPNGGSSLYDISRSLKRIKDHLGLDDDDRRSDIRRGDSMNSLPKRHGLMDPSTADEKRAAAEEQAERRNE